MSSSVSEESSKRKILYSEGLTIYRLPKSHKVPSHILELPWFTISKTTDEISVIVPSKENAMELFGECEDIKIDSGWKCFKIDAVLDFGLVGILAAVINPLKDIGVPVFVVSTYDTDYVLVKEEHLEKTKQAVCEKCGYCLVTNQSLSS